MFIFNLIYAITMQHVLKGKCRLYTFLQHNMCSRVNVDYTRFYNTTSLPSLLLYTFLQHNMCSRVNVDCTRFYNTTSLPSLLLYTFLQHNIIAVFIIIHVSTTQHHCRLYYPSCCYHPTIKTNQHTDRSHLIKIEHVYSRHEYRYNRKKNY